MKKFYTFFYIINNIEKKEDSGEAPAQIISDDPEEELADITDSCEMTQFGPKQSTIDNIMNFSRSYEVIETESLNKVGMIKN